jgi:hypothetical protein
MQFHGRERKTCPGATEYVISHLKLGRKPLKFPNCNNSTQKREMNWYYAIDGRAHGPVDDQRLAELASHETVGGETLIWHPAMSGWEPAWKAKPEIVAHLSNADLAQKARGTTDRIPLGELGKEQADDKQGAAPASGGLLGRLFGRMRKK